MESFFFSAFTVGKVVFLAGVGMWVTRHFPDKSTSLKGLSHIAVKIFLPCFLLSHLAMNLSWEMFRIYYWGCILPFITLIIGFSSSLILRLFTSPEFHGLLHLSCTFQNVISFGLGIMLNLHVASWNALVKEKLMTYALLFNVVHAVFLWPAGTCMIEKCVRALENRNTSSSVTITDVPMDSAPCNRNGAGNEKGKKGETDEYYKGEEKKEERSYQPVKRYEDYRPDPSVFHSSHSVATQQQEQHVRNTSEMSCMEYISLQCSYLLTEEVIASSLGILFSLVPPFGLLLDNSVGDIFFGGISLLAPGAVPLQVLILGISITVNNDSSVKLPLRFVVSVIFLRLVFIPLICFGIIHLLLVYSIFPSDKPFVLVMLLLTCAPTTIKSSIICSMYSYKEKEYARLLFFMYIACIFTTIIWLAIYVSYLDI